MQTVLRTMPWLVTLLAATALSPPTADADLGSATNCDQLSEQV